MAMRGTNMESDQKFNVVRTIVVGQAILSAVYITKEVIVPFLLIFLLAYVFYPVYKRLAKRLAGRASRPYSRCS